MIWATPIIYISDSSRVLQSSRQGIENGLAADIETLDSAIHWIFIRETDYAIRWIGICPVDRAIQRLNNWSRVAKTWHQ